jgi:hypothetical protein
MHLDAAMLGKIFASQRFHAINVKCDIPRIDPINSVPPSNQIHKLSEPVQDGHCLTFEFKLMQKVFGGDGTSF